MECNPDTNTCNSACCRIIPIIVNNITREQKDYYLKRGCEIDGKWVLIPCVCPYLNKETGGCKLHNTSKKPYFCKLYGPGSLKKSGNTLFYTPRNCVYNPKYKG